MTELITMGTDGGAAEDDSDFYLSCSDEEVYKELGCEKGKMGEWRPSKTEDAVKMCEAVVNEGVVLKSQLARQTELIEAELKDQQSPFQICQPQCRTLTPRNDPWPSSKSNSLFDCP